MNGWYNLKNDIMDKDLCCLCGTCIGVCPQNTLGYVNGSIENVKNACINCGLCVSVCPGGGFDYPKMNENIFSISVDHLNRDFGFYRSIIKGCSNDFNIRQHASSGGIATEIAKYMLQNNIVDYVIGVSGNGGVFQSTVLNSEEQLGSIMQSKYIFLPLNEVISFVMKHEGKYLYTGLPCEIQGMRKAAEKNNILRKRIYLYVGIFCGFNMEKDATDFLIKKSKIAEHKIQNIEYRGSKDGKTGFKITSAEKEFFISKHGYTVLNAFYSRPRCWKCYDLTAEFADVSLGDAWENGHGWSRIIIRSEKAERLVNNMIDANCITWEPSSEDDIYRSQKKLISYKKETFGIRSEKMLDFPQNHIEYSKETGLRKLKGLLFFYFLKFGQTKLARTMLNLIPIKLLEKMSEMARGDTLKQIIKYGFWGVVTVLTSFISYWLFLTLGMDYKIANIISIVITKTTAYLTNKHFVFGSHCESIGALLQEIGKFVVTRGLSGVAEFVGLILLVDFLYVGELTGKAVLIIFTTCMNYFLGKNVVYTNKK